MTRTDQMLAAAILVATALVIAPMRAQSASGSRLDVAATRIAQAGGTAAPTSQAPARFLPVQPSDVMASDLLGIAVVNARNESIGEIADVVVDNGRTIRAYIIEVGGFLGVGERYVAVDPASVTLTRQGDDDWRAVIDTTAEDLKKAPTLEYDAEQE